MNRQDACSTIKFTLCGTGILPVLEKGARCEYESTFSEVAKLTLRGLMAIPNYSIHPCIKQRRYYGLCLLPSVFCYIAVLKKVRYALCPMPYAHGGPMPNAHEYLIFRSKGYTSDDIWQFLGASLFVKIPYNHRDAGNFPLAF